MGRQRAEAVLQKQFQKGGGVMTTKTNYDWQLMFAVHRCHKWFEGTNAEGNRAIAVCDYSGVTPDQADDGVIWLDTKNVVLIEGDDYESHDEARRSSYRWCEVTNLRGHKEDGSKVKIGGTCGSEVFELVNRLGIKAAFVDWQGRTTRIQPNN